MPQCKVLELKVGDEILADGIYEKILQIKRGKIYTQLLTNYGPCSYPSADTIEVKSAQNSSKN